MRGFIITVLWYVFWFSFCLLVGAFYFKKWYNIDMKTFLLSSTGEGVMLRVRSFLILAVPFILNYIQTASGHTFAPEPIVKFIDAIFIVAFGFIHLYAWLRSIKSSEKNLPEGV